MSLSRLTLKLFVASVVLTTLGFSAQAQVLPRNKGGAKGDAPAVTAPAAGQPVAPQPARRDPGETAGETRHEGRQEARDARSDARAVGETGPQARETARETRQETRQNIQATRGADYGLWFNAQASNGLIVADISQNSVFTNVGLREGDRIVSINGQAVTSEAQFVQFLNSPNLGTQPIQIIVLRSGQQVTLTVQPTVLTQGVVNYDPLYQYGLVLDNRNPNQIIVQQVYPRTPAYYAGIRQGDVITTLGGQNIATVNAFTKGLTQANGNVALGITRSGQTRSIEIQALQAGENSARTALRPNYDAAASGSLNVGGAQGGATINTPRDANINTPAGSTTAPPATLPTPQATPSSTNSPIPAPAPRPNTGAGASGAAGANLPGANVSGAAGVNAGASGAGVSGTAGATRVNTPAAGTTPAAGAAGTAGPAGSTNPAQPK